jgi:hypothetical protein
VAVTAGAAAPSATTGAPTRITQVSARLNGTIKPGGQPTSYSFQYGPTTDYGTSTPATDAGAGTTSVHASADLTGLQAGATYHYRVVATNPSGTTPGQDVTLTTHGEQLQYALKASATSLVYGSALVLTGKLKGADSAGRQLVLEGRPYPFTKPFAAVGSVVTSDTGAYSFRVATVASNTQYRVATSDQRSGPSRDVAVTVSPLISTRLSTTHPRRGQRVKFFGTVRPERVGAPFGVQRLAGGKWVTVGGGVTRRGTGGASTWSKTIAVKRAGTYRVYVRITAGDLASGAGRPKRVVLRAR